ncbi:MAG TPA: thrombospondin type 3 repeat-containing protein, partial [Polyangiaceae bacterium]|nr:thrombospondin type 3 repeat-containing protein [Polyangiaceae bacterium]
MLGCLALSTSVARADEPAQAPAKSQSDAASTDKAAPAAAGTKGAVGMTVGTPGTAAAVEGTATGTVAPQADQAAPPASSTWEDKWVPWDTGEEEADMGFAVFGHLGLGSRLNDPPAGAGEVSARNGLRVGVTALFRPIRWFGVGIGYEHADLDRDESPVDDLNFKNTYRDLNTIWLDLRAYPLRFDPFALYINVALGPSFQLIDSDQVTIDPNSPSQSLGSKCSGSASPGLGLRGGVGAELALVSGALLWADVGPDYYFLSEENLDGCDVGAGGALMFGFRAGVAIGFEHTRYHPEAPPVEKPKDTDGDGVVDNVDACVTTPGVPSPDPKMNGCPPPPADQDNDGIVDSADACPAEAGPANADPKKNGCPLKDKDGDGVLDEVDACIDIPGVKTDDPKTNGCPGDTDGDGFRDDQDACPQEKGVDDPDPSKKGCPKLVRVTDKEIIILEQVQFDTGKATIKKASDPLLDSVANVLKEHPEILKLEVQGHTDNKGAKQLNAKLSDDRAKSV